MIKLFEITSAPRYKITISDPDDYIAVGEFKNEKPYQITCLIPCDRKTKKEVIEATTNNDKEKFYQIAKRILKITPLFYKGKPHD